MASSDAQDRETSEAALGEDEVPSVRDLEPFSPGAPFHFTKRLSPEARSAVLLLGAAGRVLHWDGEAWTENPQAR